MKNKNYKYQIHNNHKQRIKKHLTLGIILVIMLIIIKVVLIPKLQKLEHKYKPTLTIEHKIKNKNLYIKINIQNNNIKDLGKSNIEVYLDNKLIENNMIYIDKIHYTLYTNVAYRNESLLNIILINHRGDEAYYSKRLKLGG
ncbi:hypothetical protein bcCo53_000151 [Borrelia coriaceae]|uniref:Uncharacterized protein n=1 Tax=Borrelia coriaceae ATCC 43381 TaxID=1408429 RepID=W5SZ00_9SPIR|nr:hypothetical protein [Borrelia coriaceae]AHH10311.1 Hypothetical protein BCO_0099700 [Borrelia coriaceae ATCC 43381]UPA16030.1 hypothetical protein bcCo53_000151 [Borrelia coriaceae]